MQKGGQDKQNSCHRQADPNRDYKRGEDRPKKGSKAGQIKDQEILVRGAMTGKESGPMQALNKWWPNQVQQWGHIYI